MRNRFKIMVMGARSGGHLIPAISFIQTVLIKNKETEIIFVLPDFIHSQLYSLLNHELRGFDRYRLVFFKFYPLRFNFSFRDLSGIIFFLSFIMKSLIFLIRLKPDLIVGFGTLFSVPFVLFGSFLKAKTIIHEQNVNLGRANYFLAYFVDKITFSFPETINYLKRYKEKTVLTGNPLRSRLRRIDKDEALSLFGFNSERLTILVMGGSQSSASINLIFKNAIKDFYFKDRINVIHLCGKKDKDSLENFYKVLNIKARLFDFLEQMEYAYSSADLVISRAGATTISEIIKFRLPAIVIPYPYAGKHQLLNAKFLEEKGTAILIPENELSHVILRENLERIIKNPDLLTELSLRYRNFKDLDSSTLLAEEALSIL